MTQPNFPVVQQVPWNRLSPWGIGTRLIRALPSLIPALIGVLFLGRSLGPAVFITIMLAISLLVGLVPWLTTRWRVTDDQLELRSGLIRKVSATARRDRIRSVDITAGPIERLLKVRKVDVGTGVGGQDAALVLDPIPLALAEHLSRELLRRTPSAVTGSQNATDVAQPQPETEIARFRPAWLRFAPFSVAGFAVVLAAAGIGFRIVQEAGLMDRGSRIADGWVHAIWNLGPAVVIPGGIAVLLVVSSLVSVIGYVVAYWGFRLVERPDGTLHTRRGLISTASVTLERKRVRGVQLNEPVLMRLPGGAKLRAIATGTDRNPNLLPPAPRAEAVRVAEHVLGSGAVFAAPLTPHGPGARRRRRTRALLGSLAVAVPLGVTAYFLPGWWGALPATLGAAALLAAVPLARVRYRHLGTVLNPDTVVIGAPTLARTKTVVELPGIIGVVAADSVFQRRAGVLNLSVATAAGAYAAVDLTPQDAATTAAAVAPEIVAPFLA